MADVDVELCPRCSRVVDEHTVAEFRVCMRDLHDHDLPFEGQPEVTRDVEVIQAGAIVVKAAVHRSPLGAFPVLLFEFSNHDGPLPQIALVLDAQHMKSVRTLVGSAIDAAVTAARRQRSS